jgi:accessory secretory protein Asp2
MKDGRGMNLQKSFTFSPLKERGIEENVRLIIYNNETGEFSVRKEIPPKGEVSVSFEELDSHLNYKFKYQLKREGKWVDEGKYTRLLPESITDEGIKYLLYENKESDKLIVIFQAINTKQAYNYIKTIKDEKINRLYIKDEYGEDPTTKSSYYLGKHKSMNIFHATQKLIAEIVDYLGVKKENVIFAGSSKGGYAALYNGYHFGAGHILAGGPQILLGDYLGQTSEKSIRPPIFRYIAGELNEDNKEWANLLMYHALKDAKKPYPKTLIHIGVGEPHYEEHVVPFMQWVEELGIENVELDKADYNTHEELAAYYPVFLSEQVKRLVNS